MAKESAVLDFYQRFQTIQAQRETSDTLIKDLILYCERIETSLKSENLRLTKQVEDTKLDLADSIQSRRELQKRIEIFENEYSRISQEYEIFKNRNPYVTILIDGDGLIFQEQYVRQGIEGGKRAAYALRTAVADACADFDAEIEISAKVVANLTGLAKAMARDGCLDTLNDLKDFTLGFTQAKASFDFIDVGYGKERADSKIRENTRWHLQNQNCRQILLGISHDAGYAPFLDEILTDQTTRQRVSILEGVRSVPELVATGVHTFKIQEDLFRSDKLIDRTVNVRSAYSSSSATATTTTNGVKVTSPHTASATPFQPTPTPPLSTHAASPFSSYSTMAQKAAAKPASPPPQITIPLAPRSASAGTRKQQQQPKWNPGPRGLDKPIAVNQTVLEVVRKRKDNNKLCNNHFLRGPCAKADSCTFVHNYRPTQDELDAIAWLSRLNPCTSGQDCEADDCIYGHHCPHMKDGVCTHPYCKFPEDSHPPGTKFRNPNIDKNF